MTASPASRTPFAPIEWAAIAVIILVWGINNAAAKVATGALPPLLVGGLRFGIALLVLWPFLRPPFPPLRQVLPIILMIGPLHFGLIYWGFSMIENLSPMVVALQLWIPMTAFFAWRVLGETMTRSALAGMIIAFLGVAWMSLDPKGAGDLPGIAIGLLASALWALGTVFVRRMPGVPPLKMQAMTSVVAAPILLGASFAFEGDVVGAMADASWLVWGTVLFAALASTVGATALLFWLVQRREAGRVTPWFLLTPLVSCGLGIGLMGDHMTLNLALGGGATLVGVALVALSERRAAAAAAARSRVDPT
ncbi:DMT family transporter [Caulobacter mirabilis]|uniref:EamA family transporter n=1 Tax=Caulobacter mirabilis TaxID=69666 RepID=A0A2D2AZL4_9CAUL|nr:DMT family transporter [Caulobacter mirabilis]ATQ43442.1 EamA family transporter [Caulobacter mirabilis]